MGLDAAIGWEVAGPLTQIDADVADAVSDLPEDPLELCRVAQGLVMLPDLAATFGIPDDRHGERSIRSTSELLRRLGELDSTPVHESRSPDRRVVGTCRHFAVLSCAFLRHRGIPARARCGFARYFVADKYVDHWVTEYLDACGRWVRIDSEILGFPFVDHPEDLQPGEFLTGGEAWTYLEQSGDDPMCFGVSGVSHAWGVGEVRGNAVRDLAALNKIEMLPWDEWGRMEASYKGATGSEFDALMGQVAEVCASDDESAIRALYLSEDLRVPDRLIG